MSVNGGEPVQFRQRDSNKGVLLSAPLKITFKKGSNNYLTIGGYNGGAFLPVSFPDARLFGDVLTQEPLFLFL